MKILSRFILIAIISAFVFTAQADKVKFKKKSFKKALKKAKKKQLPIFVDVYADWCGPCKMMDKEVFGRDDVGDYLNEHFICFKMDADNEDYIYEKFEYEITKLPTMLFLDSDGKLIEKYVGTTTGSRVLSMAKRAAREEE